MMKTLSVLWLSGILVTAVLNASAQEGFYERESSEESEIKSERIELNGDKTYTYIYKTDWSKGRSTGTWKIDKNKVVLKSKYQLSDYTVTESKDESIELGTVKIIIQGYQKGMGPKDITSVMLNDLDSIFFQPDYEALLLEMDSRRKIERLGTAKQRDSLKNTETPKIYIGTIEEKKVRNIVLNFYGKILQYKANNQKANVFIFYTRFANDPLYRYFNDQGFFYEKRFLRLASLESKYKRVRK